MPIDSQTGRSDLDVFSKMSDASWRGLEFPCGPMQFGFSHGHAMHAYPDRDAGFVESTGRNNATHSITGYFRNGIAGYQLLYPDKWRDMVVAMADRTVGELFHPELGLLKVKPVDIRVQWDPNRRDGVDMEMQFVEADDEELSTLLGNLSPLGNCQAAARALDGAIADVKPQPELPKKLKPNLLDSIKELSGLIAQARLSAGNLISTIDGYASAIDGLAEQLRALDNPKNYPAMDACERLYAALVGLKTEVVKRVNPPIPAFVKHTAPLASVAASFGMALADFLRLNPGLARVTSVAENTPVLITL